MNQATHPPSVSIADQPLVGETQTIQRRGLTEDLASIYTGVSISALRKARMDGARIDHIPPPPYVRLGRKIIYLIDDLDLWLEANRVQGGPV